MDPDMRHELGSALVALQTAELRLADVERELGRCERFIVNLEAYCRVIDGLPTKVEWDVVRDTLRDAARRLYDE